MPVIEGADLSSVSTDRLPCDEAEYTMTIIGTELDAPKKSMVIKHRIDEVGTGGDTHGNKEWWDFINIKKNNGETNEYGLQSIKRYLEVVFGKGSPEANAAPPDTDPLVGHQVKHFLKIESYERKDGSEGKKNVSKKISKA